MAVTILLVEATPNRLRYRLTASGGGGTSANITSTGAVSPDLLTDTVQGPLKKLAKVISDGYAGFALGAQTQAKARALWLSDWVGADPAPGDPSGVPSLVPTAICRITGRTVSAEWTIDADVDTGNPILTAAVSTLVGNSVAYLDVFVPEAIGT